MRPSAATVNPWERSCMRRHATEKLRSYNSGMAPSSMVERRELRKSFGPKPALHGLSLEVRRGEIFGLLGHNGAGKSTSLGILLGQVFPDGGEAMIGGVS